MSRELKIIKGERQKRESKREWNINIGRSLSYKKVKKNIKRIDQREILLSLQESFQKYTDVNDPEIFDYQNVKKDNDEIVVEEKLWKYFKHKVQELDKCNNIRTEKQKVNCWYKIIKNILYETDKKLKNNENHIEQMDTLIKNKYKQSHNLYKQKQKLKYERQQQKKQRLHKHHYKQNKQSLHKNIEQKIKIIQQNITSLKSQINQRNIENQKLKIQFERFKNQKKLLLINLLKNGYYLHDGMIYILQKMVQINYKPQYNNFPQFLDLRSIKYLLLQYQDIVKKISEDKFINQSFACQSHRVREKQNQQLLNLTKQQHFTDIYKGTQKYLVKLLSKNQWKTNQVMTKFPKINERFVDGESQKRKEEEKRRIKAVYSKELLEKVKKIQFGVRISTFI